MDVAIGPNDEIILLSTAARFCSDPYRPCLVDVGMARYERDGARDPGFAPGDPALLSAQPRPQFRPGAMDVAVGRDGKIVVAVSDGMAITVARFDARGFRDPSFGSGGAVTTHFGGFDAVEEVIVQADGKVLVAANREAGYGEGFPFLARYRADGSLDASFGSGGSFVLNVAPSQQVRGLVALRSGRIGIGLFDCCYGGSLVVAALAPNGSFDRNFAARGWRPVRVAPASLATVLADRRNRLLVVGTHGSRAFVARFLSNGAVDRSFGRNGIAWPRTPRRVWGLRAAVDGVGRVVAGSGGENMLEDVPVGVSRLRRDGRLDRTFAGGMASFPRLDRTVAIGRQSGDRIVVVGEDGECSRSCPEAKTLIGRYLGGRSRARCFGRRATVVGTRRGETLVGTRHADVIQALGGADRVRGAGGRDLICGGPGNDRLRGGRGRDRLAGGAGADLRRQ